MPKRTTEEMGVAIRTACKVADLFHRTMESQCGSDWRKSCSIIGVVEAADAIVIDHGAIAETPVHENASPNFTTNWRFPDGSRAKTGCFGVLEEALRYED